MYFVYRASNKTTKNQNFFSEIDSSTGPEGIKPVTLLESNAKPLLHSYLFIIMETSSLSLILTLFQVERQPKKPSVVKQVSSGANRAPPLAIANPLYSLHTVPPQTTTPLPHHKSMPDIVRGQPTLSPDSSLEDAGPPMATAVTLSCFAAPEALNAMQQQAPRTNPRLRPALNSVVSKAVFFAIQNYIKLE